MGTRPRGKVDAVASELAMIAVGTTRDAVRTIFTTEAGLVVDAIRSWMDQTTGTRASRPAVPPYSALFSEMVCTRSGRRRRMREASPAA